MLGDEGSHTLDESLYVLETCSDSFFLVLPPALWCFFLFFTKIFPISSMGLGSGTPGSNWNSRRVISRRKVEKHGEDECVRLEESIVLLHGFRICLELWVAEVQNDAVWLHYGIQETKCVESKLL